MFVVVIYVGYVVYFYFVGFVDVVFNIVVGGVDLVDLLVILFGGV